LWQITDRFELVRAGGAFLYRPRREVPASARVAAPRVAPDSRPRPATRNGTAHRASTAGDRRRARAARTAPAANANPTAEVPLVGQLLASGAMALATNDLDAAIAAFRKAVFVEPDHPLAHFHLALSLERSGDRAAATRSFAAARAALGRCDPETVTAALDGYGVEEFVRLLDRNIGEGR